ncbi:SDR family oxidoreductase [Pseudomonas sp. N040]|uniref:SDR family oxidoreductase n=1 Tax=Pseudomonas sp. N040 TaxID=2785325 RepID=UPI0018A27375|nr:SDR family oxidoreductase [Pseudomonas sp. N040]MBF7729144.1 SDR family oxidoreductase [Pseudomonas sp. N040]MBW7012784.1 SDR family oxidoreductase [Pseudomonas sp. N040]
MRKVILVTGASCGFGQLIAEHLAARGHQVFGTSRRALPDTGQVRMLVLDVTDEVLVEHAVAQVIAEAGRIDVLVNNAGVGLCGAVEDTSLAEAQWQMDTNFFGPVRMIRAVLPQMRAQGSGRIITVSSLAGLAGLPFQPFYSASKYAIEGLNEALRLELSGSGIDATTLNPGDFKTGFTDARVLAQHARNGVNAAQLNTTVAIYERDEQQGADPRQVAERVARLVDKPSLDVRYPVGALGQRAGIFLKRLIPARLFERLMKATYSIR